MKLSQTTKRMAVLGYVIWVIYIVLCLGLLVLAIVAFLANKYAILIDYTTLIINIIWNFALLLSINTILNYYLLKKNYNSLSELNNSFKAAEGEAAVTLDLGDRQRMGTLTIPAVLNHSLENLNKEHQKLQENITINQRLSENISAFYGQMKTFRAADLIFDFYEYDINNSVFVFMSGLIISMTKKTEETEITADELFNFYNLSISFKEFKACVDDAIGENTDMSFECSIVTELGKTHWIRFWGRLSNDKTRMTGAVTDITREIESKNFEKERALRDGITGFYNRNALQEIAGKAISECAENEKVIFVYIGLTGYQDFQERFGKMAGHRYIHESAKQFKPLIKGRMIPFRWLGPDFLILVTGVKSIQKFRQDVIELMGRVEDLAGDVDGIAVSFPVAVGYAVSGIHAKTPAELLEYASFAEHEAMVCKEPSPNKFNYERFAQAHQVALRRTHIKDIIENNQLTIVFQPIISLKTGELFGFEALSRPANPVYTSIVDLIDDAEASGNYVNLEKRMVYNALNSYTHRDIQYKDHYLFINTAPYCTLDEDDYNDIKNRFFDDMNVVFEVIERDRMETEEINLRKSIVKNAGAKFALDDFGSGYSNHLALLSLEPDIIKIDRQLVQNINEDLRKQYMLEDIISYARYRGTRVLAEGVETKEELETLCKMSIDYVQGFFIAKPNHELITPDDEIKDLIKSINLKTRIQPNQAFIVIQETFSKISKKLGEALSIVLYLIAQMGKKLNFDAEKQKAMGIITMLHDIGKLSPGGQYGKSTDYDEISYHSIFGYLIFREFSPCPAYSRAILYHHKRYNADNETTQITIPEEAYLLSAASSISDVILDELESSEQPLDHALKNLYENVMSRLSQDDYMPEHRDVLVELCQEGILNKIYTGEYKEELLDYINEICLNKAEVEGILRTFVYSITFRNQYKYSHARNMVDIVDLFGRITKQSWNLLETNRLAAGLYNIAMLFIPKDEFQKKHDPRQFHAIMTKSLEAVNDILFKAGLNDVFNILKVSAGEKAFGNNHVLMSKDIIDGAKILNLADIFASIIENGEGAQDLSYNDAINELISISKDNENLYHSSLELIGEYIEDVEARIKTGQDDIEKHYNNVMSVYRKLKSTFLGHYENDTL